MRTILLNIASSLGCTALILAQKPNLPETPLFRIYETGQPYFIDHTGNLPFPCNYIAISPFSQGLARVKSASGNMGLINRSGQLVVDTMGNVIVRPGTYTGIYEFKDGYAVVNLKGGEAAGLIDGKGRLLFSRPFKNDVYIDAKAFGNGIGTINLSALGKSYPGFIGTNGQLLLHDSTVKDIHPFGSGRAFIKRQNDEFCMIDTRMQTVGTIKFSDVDEQGFINGYARVHTADGWGIVDTNARFVARPAYDEIDEAGFQNGLLKVMVHGKLSLVNTEGKIVWQSKTSSSENDTTAVPSALSDLNVDQITSLKSCPADGLKRIA